MPGGDIINATNRSSDSGFGGAKPCIRSGGIMPLDDVSHVAEASRPSTNGFNLRFVSHVACAPDLQILAVNLQLALRTIRSLVSVLTRNRPWVTGEVQLASRSVGLPSYKVSLCLSTGFSAN